MPEPNELGRQVVETRANRLIEDSDAEEYWEGEQESPRELMELRKVQA